MKTIQTLILILFFSVSASAQTYLKVADKAEYEIYKKWCQEPIKQHLVINVVIKKQLVNGQYSDSTGLWYAVYPLAASMLKIGAPAIAEPNQQLYTFSTMVYIQRRKATIADFYTNWITRKIP